jgi:hypothetical protein
MKVRCERFPPRSRLIDLDDDALDDDALDSTQTTSRVLERSCSLKQ